MKLTLTTNDGEVLEQWNIEEEFGDVTKAIPRHLMYAALMEEVAKRLRFERAVNPLGDKHGNNE